MKFAPIHVAAVLAIPASASLSLETAEIDCLDLAKLCCQFRYLAVALFAWCVRHCYSVLLFGASRRLANGICVDMSLSLDRGDSGHKIYMALSNHQQMRMKRFSTFSFCS